MEIKEQSSTTEEMTDETVSMILAVNQHDSNNHATWFQLLIGMILTINQHNSNNQSTRLQP